MTRRVDDRDLSPSTGLAWLAGVVVVAAAIRLPELGAGLWFDEILTLVDHASKSFGEILTTYGSANNHVLYSIAAATSLRVFGESAWALRLPAVVFGVVGVAAVYGFGTRVTSRRAALLAAAIAAVSYHHVWFSQNARGYTALMALTLIGSALFLDLVRDGTTRRGRVVAYAVTMALAAYTHLTGLVVVVAHGLVWAGRAWRMRDEGVRAGPPLAVAAAGLTTGLLYAPMLPDLIDTFLRPDPALQSIRSGTRWTSPSWAVREALQGLARSAPGGAIGLIGGAIVGLAGVVDHARRSRIAVSVMVVPPILVGAIVLATGHNLWPRFLFFAAGFGILVAVRGVFVLASAIAPRRATTAATVVLVAVTVGLAVRVPAAWGPKQDYEGARSFVESGRETGDAVVTLAMATLPYADDPGDWTGLVTDDPAELERIERTHDRTWAIWAFPTWVEATQPRVWNRVRAEYRRVAEFEGTVRGGTVVVAVRG